MDPVRLGLPHHGHPARGVVVVPGARLGRVLGMGPGGERRPPAVAGGHGLPPLGDGPAATGPAADLEPLAGGGRLQPDHPRDLPDPVRGHPVGPLVLRVHHRPAAARLLRRGPVHRGGPDRLAGGPAPFVRRHRLARSAGRVPSWPTTSSSSGFAFVVLLGTVFPLLYEALNHGTQVGGGGPVLQPVLRARGAGPALPHGRGPGPAVAEDHRRGDARPAGRARRRRRGGGGGLRAGRGPRRRAPAGLRPRGLRRRLRRSGPGALGSGRLPRGPVRRGLGRPGPPSPGGGASWAGPTGAWWSTSAWWWWPSGWLRPRRTSTGASSTWPRASRPRSPATPSSSWAPGW